MRDEAGTLQAVLRASVLAPGERTFEEVVARVAQRVAEAEPAAQRSRVEARFRDLVASRRFVPSIPILSNAGRSDQLAACFVLAPEDRLADIYASLERAARIQQLSGGVGVELSPPAHVARRFGGQGVARRVRSPSPSCSRTRRASTRSRPVINQTVEYDGRRHGTAGLRPLPWGRPEVPHFSAGVGPS